MFHISVIGYKPRNLSARVTAKFQTSKLLRIARTAPGCLRAYSFRKNDITYACIVWENKPSLRFFESTELFRCHVDEMDALSTSCSAYNFVSEILPAQRWVHEMWGAARYALGSTRAA